MLEGSLTISTSMPRFSMARLVLSTRAANSARLNCNVGLMPAPVWGITVRDRGGTPSGRSVGEAGAGLKALPAATGPATPDNPPPPPLLPLPAATSPSAPRIGPAATFLAARGLWGGDNRDPGATAVWLPGGRAGRCRGRPASPLSPCRHARGLTARRPRDDYYRKSVV